MPSLALHALALAVTLGIAAFALGVIAHMGRAYGCRALAALRGQPSRKEFSATRSFPPAVPGRPGTALAPAVWKRAA